MNRWLLLGCAAVVAFGLSVRAFMGSGGSREAAPAEAAKAVAGPSVARAPMPSPVAAAPAAAPGDRAASRAPAGVVAPAVRELDARLLKDDSLAPPPGTASIEEHRAYDRTVMSIARGQDPLAQPASHAGAPRSPLDSPEEVKKRMEERRKVATERMKKRREEMRKSTGEHFRKMRETQAAHRDPNRPKPAPLFDPPKLGPAVTDIEGSESQPKQ
jgi:hypothetical protein